MDPRTKESELEVQRIIHLQNIANNLPDAFTDLRSVSKSHNPAINVPERVEIPIKVTQLPNQNKRGRSTATRAKRVPRKKRNINSKGINANQPQVDRHQDVQLIHQLPSTNVHTIDGAGTSENPDSSVLGNNEESQGVLEISTNFINSGESFNRKTTIVDNYFSSKIALDLQPDLEPKTMAECIKFSDCIKWKEAIEA